jgi:hypothetical protein
MVMTFRREAAESASGTIPGGQAALCDLCAAVIQDGTEQYATVLDSSAALPTATGVDGERRVVACTSTHLDELTSYYETRPYDEDELLAQIVLRARRRMGHEATLEDLAFMTRLSIVQTMRAMRWTSIWMQWLSDGDEPTP